MCWFYRSNSCSICSSEYHNNINNNSDTNGQNNTSNNGHNDNDGNFHNCSEGHIAINNSVDGDNEVVQ